MSANVGRVRSPNLNPEVPDTSSPTLKILFLGPVGAAEGGGKATVDVFLREVDQTANVSLVTIDTAPAKAKLKRKDSAITWEAVRRAGGIFTKFWQALKDVDVVLAYTNNYFTIFVLPMLHTLAAMRGKPFFLKPVGGSLDLDLERVNPLSRKIALRSLTAMRGVFPQTQLLETQLAAMGVKNVFHIPGWRETPSHDTPRHCSSDPGRLKLIFLSQITETKGVWYLLDALRGIQGDASLNVTCDFVGPIFSDMADAFPQCLEEIQGAQYLGEIDNTQSHATLAQYDCLVLPTHLRHEGHPGVLVEAIQVGLPVIATRHRALPELIQHEVDGLLVPPRDAGALEHAIREMAIQRERRRAMAKAIGEKRNRFDSQAVIGELIAEIRKRR